jgi:hypothetical protein
MEVSGQLHGPVVVSFTALKLYPRGTSPRYPLDRKLGGPHSRSGRSGEIKNLSLPGIKPGPSSPLPVAIPTNLSWLLIFFIKLEYSSVLPHLPMHFALCGKTEHKYLKLMYIKHM